MIGGGFVGPVGLQSTDFVFIFNVSTAVDTFAQVGSLTLGGHVTIAPGPIGHNAADTTSRTSVAGIFAYSKTKSLFPAGVSLKGFVIIERRDANEKFYNRKVSARELLSGNIPVPARAEPLMRVLNSRVFVGTGGTFVGDAMYNDVPDRHEDVDWQGQTGNCTGSVRSSNEYQYHDNPVSSPTRASTSADDPSTWTDDPYVRGSNRAITFDRLDQNR